MLSILLVSSDQGRFEDLISSLKVYGDIELESIESGKKALEIISGKSVDLVISDEDLGDMTGLELVRQILKVNFMINFAVVSGLSPDDFHEASEGLGVMSQLPKHPVKKDAEDMIKVLKQLKGM